jgi:hypothetical protein
VAQDSNIISGEKREEVGGHRAVETGAGLGPDLPPPSLKLSFFFFRQVIEQ